jgi:hypothetical protein
MGRPWAASAPRARAWLAGPDQAAWSGQSDSFFSFLIFLFSISFKYFAKQIQNTSNQFVKFSKIQLNILGQ